MSNLYKALKKERKVLGSNSVLSKLLVIAFTNKENPDELPDKFILRDVCISEEKLKALFNRLGMNVNIRLMIKRNGMETEFSREVKLLYTYEITKKDKA